MFDVFCLIFALSAIVLFSVLAARAEGRMWHEISRHNGEREIAAADHVGEIASSLTGENG